MHEKTGRGSRWWLASAAALPLSLGGCVYPAPPAPAAYGPPAGTYAYAPAAEVGFLLDDFLQLDGARRAVLHPLGWLPLPGQLFYRPLRYWLTWELGWRAWGFNPLPGKAARREQGEGQDGKISFEYIDYCREDVAATATLYDAIASEYRRHPIDLQITKAFSPASIGKAYLKAMGVKPRLERQPNFPRDLLGRAMCAYYGGRTECHIRRVPVPVVYLDFLSMYPTVNALMDLWRHVTATRIQAEDATDEIRRLVDQITVADCRRIWRCRPASCCLSAITAGCASVYCLRAASSCALVVMICCSSWLAIGILLRISGDGRGKADSLAI